MSFWNSGPTYHSAGVAILFIENFKCEMKNIVNHSGDRVITITFTLNQQNFHITTLYGRNKLHHRENLFESLTSHITSNQNTKIDGFFFCQSFLSRTLTTHRTAREGRGSFSIPLYHFHPLTNIQTFISNFACEMTMTYF